MILFIGHDASLTGAPRMFLYLIKYIKKEYDLKIEIILKESGPFINDYLELGNVHIWHKKWLYESKMSKRLKKRFFDSDNYRQKRIIKHFSKNRPAVIVNNTIVNGDILERFKNENIPVLSIIHELEYVMNLFQFLYGLTLKTLNNSTEYVAVSEATKNNMIKNYHISESKISVCYEAVPYLAVDKSVSVNNVRTALNIPEQSFIAGACGGMGWRKGSDLFLRVAKELRENTNIYFLWVGGNAKSGLYHEFMYEAKKYNVLDQIRVISFEKDISKYYQLMDVFLMTSREDPFPLVNLEAALHGIPIIGFKDSGGTEEFLDETSGILVEYGEVGDMAQQVINLYNDIDLRERLSKGIKNRSDIFNTEKSFKQICSIINKYLLL